MAENHAHTTHVDVAKRLKRATGHLQKVIGMIESGQACGDIAQQLHAVERAIGAAKKTLIHDHLDHCLEDVVGAGPAAASASLKEFKDITKYL